MATCDFCNEQTNSPTLYGAAAVQQAARTGFRPSGLSGMDAVAASLGIRNFDPGPDWVAQVMADRTDWALCHTCVGQLKRHLAGDLPSPSTTPRGSSTTPPPPPAPSPALPPTHVEQRGFFSRLFSRDR